jgi:hypothetical protein
VHTLLSRPAGEVCLVAGCLLELAGLRWTDRLVDSVDSTLTEPASNHADTANTVRSLNSVRSRSIRWGRTT